MYTGSLSAGGSVEFSVSPNGAAITRFEVTGIQAYGCSTNEVTKDYPNGLPIADHAFSDSNEAFTLNGSFAGTQAASGSITVSPSFGGCSGTVSWTASTSAAPPPTRPSASARSSQKLSTALSRGVSVTVACPQACRIVSELLLDRSTARKVRLAATKSVVVGRATATRTTAGTTTLRVRFKSKARKRLRSLRRLKLTLRTRVTSGAGDVRSFSTRVTLVRSLPSNREPAFPDPLQSTSTTNYEYDSSGRLSGAVTTITITSPATDPDGDPLTYSWEVTSGSVTSNGLSATWRRAIGFGQEEDGDAVVTVRDGRGGSDTFTFRFR
jgi:hypothetical protein